MPIPAAPDGSITPTSVVVALFRQLHDELRSLIETCDQPALDFVPCDAANSISTIVTHLLGSETESLKTAAGIVCDRDRDEEFRRGPQSAAALLAQLIAADRLLDELAPALTDEQLTRIIKVPKREFMRRGINQHPLEKICWREPVCANELAECLEVLEE